MLVQSSFELFINYNNEINNYFFHLKAILSKTNLIKGFNIWYTILRGKVNQVAIMGVPIGYHFSIKSFILASAHTCLFLEEVARSKKKTNSDFMAMIWSAEHFNFSESKKNGKGRESIQSSTTTVPRHQM